MSTGLSLVRTADVLVVGTPVVLVGTALLLLARSTARRWWSRARTVVRSGRA